MGVRTLKRFAWFVALCMAGLFWLAVSHVFVVGSLWRGVFAGAAAALLVVAIIFVLLLSVIEALYKIRLAGGKLPAQASGVHSPSPQPVAAGQPPLSGRPASTTLPECSDCGVMQRPDAVFLYCLTHHAMFCDLCVHAHQSLACDWRVVPNSLQPDAVSSVVR